MWQSLVEHCGTVVSTHGPLLTALLLAGLAGGATHCAGMCGPFVLAQVGARALATGAAGAAGATSELQRLRGAALLPYHLGRATTYAGLGAVAATLTGGLAVFTGLHLLAAGLLTLTAATFLLAAARNVAPAFATPAPMQRYGDALSRLSGRLFRDPRGWQGYGLGLTLGFIPCGLLYGAIAAAASTGDPAMAALGMLAFAAGTAPSLVIVGWLGELAARRYRQLARRVVTPLLAVNAAVLLWLAWRMAAT